MLVPGARLPDDARAVPRLIALLLLMASAGCHRYPDDTPVEAYRSMLSAVQRDDDARTLALLSERSRTALLNRAEALSKASGGTLHPAPVDLLQAEMDALRKQAEYERAILELRVASLERSREDHETHIRSIQDGVTSFKVWSSLANGGAGLVSLAALLRTLGLG